jgi:type II secretory pathway component PulM
MSTLSDRLSALTLRERVFLGGGLGIAALILIYTFVWEPWQDELDRLRARVPEKQQTLQWMTSRVEEIRALRERGNARADESGLPLLTLVERSANQADIREVITRMNPGESADQVRVWMENADFDRWLRWLKTLSENGIVVAEANIDRSADNQVSIRTTLQR